MKFPQEQSIDKDVITPSDEEIRQNTEIYIICAFLYIMSCVQGTAFFTLYDGFYFLLYMIIWFGVIQMYMQPHLTVAEGGKNIWIFEKYKFSPTSAYRLCYAKLLRLAKFCSIQLIIVTFLQLFTALVIYQKISLANFTIILISLLGIGQQAINIIYHAYRAFRKA